MDEEDLRARVAELTESIRIHTVPNGRVEEAAVEYIRYTGRQFHALPKPPREELLGPLVVRGERLVIGAGTGEGKTTLVWQILGALCRGSSFLGWKAPRPCRVLLVDCEQTHWDIDRLLEENGLDDSDQIEIISVPDGMSLAPGSPDCIKLERDIAEGWDVIALDPLYKLHDGDQNDEQQAKALMKILDGWRAKYNFNLILPAHMRKRQNRMREQDFTLDEIAGSASYLRGAEVVLGLKLQSDGHSRLYFFKSRGPGLPVRTSWPLKYDRYQGYSLNQTAADLKKNERDLAVANIRTALIDSAGAGCEVDVLESVCGRKRSFVFEVLKELNALSRTAPGSRKKLYFLPDVQPDQQDLELLEEEDPDDE